MNFPLSPLPWMMMMSSSTPLMVLKRNVKKSLLPFTHENPIGFEELHDLFIIFQKCKHLVEEYFNLPLIALYFDNDGGFLQLKTYLSTHDISHYTTPPYTLELNGTTERCHCHIVETSHALLHYSKLPPNFWIVAFETTTYLINSLPTPDLNI